MGGIVLIFQGTQDILNIEEIDHEVQVQKLIQHLHQLKKLGQII